MYTDYILIFFLVFALLLVLIATGAALKIKQRDKNGRAQNLPEIQIKTARFLLTGLLIAQFFMLFSFPASGLTVIHGSGLSSFVLQILIILSIVLLGNSYFKSFFIPKMAGNNQVHYVQFWLGQLLLSLIFYYIQKQHLDEKWLSLKNVFFRSFIFLTLLSLYSHMSTASMALKSWTDLFLNKFGFIGSIISVLAIISLVSLNNFTYSLKYRLRFENPYYPVKLNLHLNRLVLVSSVMLFLINMIIPVLKNYYK